MDRSRQWFYPCHGARKQTVLALHVGGKHKDAGVDETPPNKVTTLSTKNCPACQKGCRQCLTEADAHQTSTWHCAVDAGMPMNLHCRSSVLRYAHK